MSSLDLLDAVMRDRTRAGVGLKAKQKEKELVTAEAESQLWQGAVFEISGDGQVSVKCCVLL